MSSFQNNNHESQDNHNEDIQNESNDGASELNRLKDSFLRINADFDNYKKRVIREKAEWISTSQSEVLFELLNIIDDFDRALSSYKKNENKDIDKCMEGFELIHKSLYKFLDKHGVKEIKDFEFFNPEYHEAIAQLDSSQHKSGQIVSVAQKGFLFNDRVLRPARVTVAK